MALSARRRPGTSSSFWRRYNNAQLYMVTRCMRTVHSGLVREPSIGEQLADFERTKRPASSHFVSIATL
jgi:hypothetical protein